MELTDLKQKSVQRLLEFSHKQIGLARIMARSLVNKMLLLPAILSVRFRDKVGRHLWRCGSI